MHLQAAMTLVLALIAAVALLWGPLLAQQADAADTVWVTCGSTIKLAHAASNARLHSHGVAYSRGSQQQSVTGYPDSADGQSYWIVHGAQDAPCAPGMPLKRGQAVRLQHGATRKWLHSHQFYAPISGNQEVSAFGSDTSSDGGDVWTVEWDSKAKHWKQDAKIRLKHRDTSVLLSSSAATRFGQPIHGQQEVCGVGSKTKDTEWFAAEGIYLPRADGHGSKSKKAAAAGDAGGKAAADDGKGEL